MPERWPPACAAFDWNAARVASRRNLPHVVQGDGIYYVTMRLADSIARTKLNAWAWELNRWLECNPPPHSFEQQEQYAELGYRRMERWLDRGEGSCLLKQKELREEVEYCLHFADGSQYWLGDYAIMPNHLHALFRAGDERDPRKIVGRWRSISTHRINRVCGRSGSLWQDEPFDHVVRNEAALQRIRRYIQSNGVRLPAGWHSVGCGKLFPQGT